MLALARRSPTVTLPSIFCGAGSSGARRQERLPALIGDVNGDGKADLVWNELGGLNRFYVGLSQGNGKFQFLPAQDRGGVSA